MAIARLSVKVHYPKMYCDRQEQLSIKTKIKISLSKT
jgi:hypothetical protein